MAAHGVRREIEIKLPVPDAAAGRRLLRDAGFRLSRRRVFESNTVFDTARRDLRKRGLLLRLRSVGRRCLLTFKDRSVPGKHKSREEIEFEITGCRACEAVLERLGFAPVFRYQKYRAEYRLDAGPGIATLDETPIGVYIELEGAPRWIDRVARRLGFTELDYITKSYGVLYEEYRRLQGAAPRDMLFIGIKSS